MTSLSLTIAEHVSTARFEHLPDAAVAAAKLSLLDALGVSLAASGLSPECRIFIDLALEAGGTPQSTIIGFGFKAPMLMAALANGALSHAMDFEDAYEKSPMHPNAQVIPAVLALAEARGAVSGRDLITAIAVGCDLTCRLGLAMTSDPASFGWYTPPVLGALGAAAACANLMRFQPVRVLDALSLAIGPGGSSAEVKYSTQSTIRAIRDAFASHAGLLAARLAAGGVRGFDQPLEGKAAFFKLYAHGGYEAGPLLEGLGKVFHGADVSFKPWPSCRGTHPFIEAAFDMAVEYDLAPEDVASISAGGGRLQSMLFEPEEVRKAPKNAIDAKFSGPFTIALALTRRRVTLDDFSAHDFANPALLSLAALCDYTVAQGAAGDDPTAGDLTLRLKDGRILTRRIDQPLGHPAKPMSRQAIEAKFKACARHAAQPLGESGIEALRLAVANLELTTDGTGALFNSKEAV